MLELTENSPSTLTTLYQRAPVAIAHHLTLQFGVIDLADGPARFRNAAFGDRFVLKVIGVAHRNDGALDAVAVALLEEDGTLTTEGISTNRVPHITVSNDPARAEPVESNALLEAGFEAVADGPILTATLGSATSPLGTNGEQ